MKSATTSKKKRRNMKHSLSSLILVLLLKTVSSTTPSSQEIKTSIDNFIGNVSECYNVNGLALSISRGNQSFYEAGYGSARQGHAMGADTKVCVGSVSKSFTVSLLAMLLPLKYSPQDLAGMGITNHWDIKVTTLLDQDFKFGDPVLTQLATLRDLLAHKTGYFRYDELWMAGATSVDDMMTALKEMKPVVEPRTQFYYNNWMYTLAGKIAEKIGGDTYESLLKKHLLVPLNMSSTELISSHGNWTDYAGAYLEDTDGTVRVVDWKILEQAALISPAGGVCTTARDLSRYTIVWGSGRDVTGKRIVTGASIDLLRQAVSPQFALQVNGHAVYGGLAKPWFPVDRQVTDYCLGWTREVYNGYTAYSHDGSLPGFSASVTVFLGKPSLGISLVANGPSTLNATQFITVAKMYIADVVLGETPWLNYSTACSFPEPYYPKPAGAKIPVVTNLPPTRPLVEYAGNYSHAATGVLQVIVDNSDNRLHVRFGAIGDYVLYPYTQPDVFRVESAGEFWFLSALGATQYTAFQFLSSSDGQGFDGLQWISGKTVILELRNTLAPPVTTAGTTMDPSSCTTAAANESPKRSGSVTNQIFLLLLVFNLLKF